MVQQGQPKRHLTARGHDQRVRGGKFDMQRQIVRFAGRWGQVRDESAGLHTPNVDVAVVRADEDVFAVRREGRLQR